MKKIFLTVLSVMMMLSLVACGEKEEANVAPTEEVVEEQEEAPVEEEKAIEKKSERTVEQLEAYIAEESVKETRDSEKLLEALNEAADKDSAYAMYYLVCEYHNGYDVAKNEKKAAEYVDMLQASCEKGNAATYEYLADCYLYGWGVESDATKALEYAEQGANRGRVGCYIRVSDIYGEGFEGVEVDAEKAIEYAQKAIESEGYFGYALLGNYHSGRMKGFEDYADSKLKFENYYAYVTNEKPEIIDATYYAGIANCYINGDGVDADVEEGIKWCEKAVDAGYTVAWTQPAVYYLNAGDYENAIVYYDKYMDSEKDLTKYASQNVCVYAGITAYYAGDIDKAKEYWKKSVKINEPLASEAQNNLDSLEEQ